MTYFLAYYGIWLSSAFLVGVLTGFGCQQSGEAENTDLLRRGDFLFALFLCLFVAIAQVTLGRVALYFESVVFLFAAFLAGVGVIIVWGGRISRDHIEWRVGACAVALICLAANSDAARSLEADLGHRLGSLVERAGGDPLNFEVSGRDVFLPADTPERKALAERINRAAGVRTVWKVDALSPPATELRDRALASAAARLAANKAAEAAWAQAQSASATAVAAPSEPAGAAKKERRLAALPKSAKKDRMAEGRSAERPAQPAPETTSAASGPVVWKWPAVWNTPNDPTLPSAMAAKESDEASLPVETVAALDASPCRAAVAAAAATEKIRFAVASASLGGGWEPFLVKLAGLLKQCPGATLEIRGHADAQGTPEENRNLSLRRARSVADQLGRIGVERDRLSSVGYGDEQPLAKDDTPASRAENRRVEFAVK